MGKEVNEMEWTLVDKGVPQVETGGTSRSILISYLGRNGEERVMEGVYLREYVQVEDVVNDFKEQILTGFHVGGFIEFEAEAWQPVTAVAWMYLPRPYGRHGETDEREELRLRADELIFDRLMMNISLTADGKIDAARSTDEMSECEVQDLMSAIKLESSDLQARLAKIYADLGDDE